ncbi:MAG: DUF481 domain-containing protein [Bacteroidetes bacterium]|nr:DUF481 domain-containing protein [Bacteroidota bacterium]
MRFIILFLLVFATLTQAQVVNIEGKRFLKDTNGFVGRADFNFNINQNVQQVLILGLNVHAQYVHNRNRILAISDLSFFKAGKQDFVNSGFQHLRYNYKIANRLTMEAFVQAQYNLALQLNQRNLAGAGPRIKIWKKPKFKMYAACLYMYEFQVQNNDSIREFNNRISAYASFNIDFKKLDFVSTTYFQPNLADFNDYRIASDNVLEIIITNRFNFKTGINLLFDTQQPLRVPNLTYIYRNGLSFKF